MLTTIYCVVIIFVLYINLIYPFSHVTREIAQHEDRLHYYQGEKPSKKYMHEVLISIKQLNLDIIEEILFDVSNPNSLIYGKHLSFDEVGLIVSNRNATNQVIKYLKSFDVNVNYQSFYGEYIKVSGNIETFELLFNTEFYLFHPIDEFNQLNYYKTVVRSLSYSLPIEINEFIHSVHYLTNLPPLILSKPIMYENSYETIDTYRNTNENSESTTNSAINTLVYPRNLYKTYGITGNGNGYGNQSFYGSLGQTFLPSDLQKFQKSNNLNNYPVSNYIGPIPNNSVCRSINTSSYCYEASLDVQYITAIGLEIPTTYFYDPGNDYDYINFITNVSNLVNPTYVYSISYGTYEHFMTSSEIDVFNIEAIKLGVRGVTLVASSGDDGISGFLVREIKNTSYCGYFAQFPASSPYVTAVGGTMGGMELSGTKSEETVCSSNLGAIITSGGGFSNSMPALGFQYDAINSYISRYDAIQSDLFMYNISNRGYPDISMAAHNYVVYIGGFEGIFDGTSASAPVFAGLVSLVNSQRLQNSNPTLGWLNPSIYSNNGDYARDITKGDNNCTADSSVCCPFGFRAEVGWDPVTGFGSIDYPKFLSYYESLVSSPSSTLSPTLSPTTNIPTFQPTNNNSIETKSKSSSIINQTNIIIIVVLIVGFVLISFIIFVYLFFSNKKQIHPNIRQIQMN